jgi:hypothetical protein
MDATITVVHHHVPRPILPQYSKNQTRTCKSPTAAQCNIYALFVYIVILALIIFSVPIGHGVLHTLPYYRDVSILSSLKVGAVGGGVICTPVLVLMQLWHLYFTKHGDRFPKPVDPSIITVVIFMIILLLLLAFGAGSAGAAVLHHAQVLNVWEAMGAATLGCFLIILAYFPIIGFGDFLLSCICCVESF